MTAYKDSEKFIIVVLEAPEVKQNVTMDLLLKRRMKNSRTVPWSWVGIKKLCVTGSKGLYETENEGTERGVLQELGMRKFRFVFDWG